MKRISVPDETDKKILEYLSQGFAPKEIAGKVWKSKDNIHYRLSRLRRYYNSKTTYELITKITTNQQNITINQD